MPLLDFFDSFMKKKPVKTKIEFKDFEIAGAKKGSYDDFKKKVVSASLIMLVVGKRGSGKTALGMKLLEMFHNKSAKRCFVIGYEFTRLPSWIKKAETLNKIPNNSVVLIDEGAITFSARDAMKDTNKFLSRVMAIARHKNLTLILVTQNSAMIELNVLRLADTLLIKEPSLLQSEFERKFLKDVFKEVSGLFKEKEDSKPLFYVIDDDFQGMLSFDLPAFWSEKISKSFKEM